MIGLNTELRKIFHQVYKMIQKFQILKLETVVFNKQNLH